MAADSPDTHINLNKDPAKLRRALSHWYREAHREMPWREAPGRLSRPYHTLLSETMLQQTQVATVIDYFHRFLERFPDIESLAAADESEVLHLWQGLGYYRRARNLHKAARIIVQDHGSVIPDDFDALMKLPGIGRYTAGAIASIAYGQRVPVLDGNVMRILARIYGIDRPVDETITNQMLWQLAAELLPARNTASFTMGDMNQCLMELGATVCTPKNPKCNACPVCKHCEALDQNRIEELPIMKAKAKQKPVSHWVIGIIAKFDDQVHILAEHRPEVGLWSNMWAPLTYESKSQNPPTLQKSLQTLITTEDQSLLNTFSHMTTHRKITFSVHSLGLKHDIDPQALLETLSKKPEGRLQWLTMDNLNLKPMSNPHRKAFDMIKQATHI